MSHAKKTKSSERAPDAGSAVSSVTKIPAPSHVDGVSLDVLRWAARERGVTMTMMYSALKADPSLIEGVLAAAKGKDVTKPKPADNKHTRSIEDDSTSTQVDDGLLVQLDSPINRLFVPEARPRVCQIPGSQAVRTTGQFVIEMAQYDIRIYNSSGQQITRIWGDPHVDENGGGDNWHFGNDSTFILTDGTKICLDTEKNGSGEWLVEGINIIAGNDRYHFGTGGKDGLHKDAQKWDRANADTAAGDNSAGLFAMKPDGTWAMQGTDGHFYDVKDESWGNYQASGDVDLDESKRTEINELQQHAVLFDHLPENVEAPRGGRWNLGPDPNADYETMELTTPKQRPSFLKHKASAIVQSPLGYVVEMQGTEVIIWDIKGQQITRIWGDPHVNEKNGGDTWHFGGNSTFILPDGSKIRCDTEPIASNFWVVRSVDVTLGSSRFHYNGSGGGAMSDDGREHDKANSDADNRYDAGIFALTPNGEWAVMARNGRFYDINTETWEAYQQDPDVDLAAGKEVKVTGQQLFASRSDQMPDDLYMPAIGSVVGGLPNLTEDEKRAKLDALERVMPAAHLQLIAKREPDILPALAMDLVMAEHVASMSFDTLKLLLDFAPGLVVHNPHIKPPEGASWPMPEMTGRADPWWG